MHQGLRLLIQVSHIAKMILEVAGLCKGLPKRVQALAEAEGGRLPY